MYSSCCATFQAVAQRFGQGLHRVFSLLDSMADLGFFEGGGKYTHFLPGGQRGVKSKGVGKIEGRAKWVNYRD